jgi:hypothetical protein
MGRRGIHIEFWQESHRSVDGSKMNLRGIGWSGMDGIVLAQDRGQWGTLDNTVMNLWVPYNVGKFLSICTNGSLSRRAQLHRVSENILVMYSSPSSCFVLLRSKNIRVRTSVLINLQSTTLQGKISNPYKTTGRIMFYGLVFSNMRREPSIQVAIVNK